jgi:hypothetical protein
MDTIVGIEIFPIISFLIFFSFFIGLLIYVKRLSKSHVQDMGALPLESDEFSSTHNLNSNE